MCCKTVSTPVLPFLDATEPFLCVLGAGMAVDRVLIQEDVARCGQLVTNYSLTVGGGGKPLATGGSIGHCRIHRLSTPVLPGEQISLNILQSLGSKHCAQPRFRRIASFSHANCMADASLVRAGVGWNGSQREVARNNTQ